jgi:indolepyruvate ferredoxin oxidoreductase alpha subunit
VLVGDAHGRADRILRVEPVGHRHLAARVADGLRKAGLGRRAVALFGDSAFFHTAIPAICNAAVSGGDILMVVLDNGATVTSGFQPNPGVGRDALGRPAPALSIERIAEACGVGYVRGIGPDAPPSALRDALCAALAHRDLALLVVRTRCDRRP